MKQCQLLTQAQLLLKMLDKCLLLLVFHTAGKNSLSGKVPGQTAYIEKDPLWMRVNMYIFRAFPRRQLDLGKVYLWGTWLCRTCPEVFSKWWGRAGLTFAENKSSLQMTRYGAHRGSSLKGMPLLKDISFDALKATCP